MAMTDKELVSHYKELFDRYGFSSNAVQYRDEQSHFARFQELTKISSELHSVLDIGAGLGHFYQYLRNDGFSGKYLGLEVVEEFVESANRLMKKDKDAEVQLFDVNSGEFPTGYQYGFVSGVFNNHRENAQEFMFDTLKKLWTACEEGMAFNVLSSYVDYFDNELFYIDPEKVFTFLKKELKGHTAMFHDYVTIENGYPYDVTFFVRKQPRIA